MEASKPTPPLIDEEEPRVQAGIASDLDNPEMTDEQLAAAKPFGKVFPVLLDAIQRSQDDEVGFEGH